jgi:hypothetical protein
MYCVQFSGWEFLGRHVLSKDDRGVFKSSQDQQAIVGDIRETNIP